MKTAFKILALGAAIAASATMAKADPITGQISVAGPDTFSESAGTISFPTGMYLVLGTSTGTMSGFTAGTAVTWDLIPFSPVPLGTQSANGSSLVFNTPPGGALPVFTAMAGGETLTFTLDSEAWFSDNTNAFNAITVEGTGTFSEVGTTNYAVTPATFLFTAQENPNGTSSVDFSGTGYTIAPAPEPSSLALLGTGLLGVAAFARRRFLSRLSA